jgi:uncharacterized damage-inducible protein DinB
MSLEFPDPSMLDGPGQHETDPRALLTGYLDWYREALQRKLDGLSVDQLRSPVEPMGWSPLGLVQHLTWVERRWLRWGFTAEQIDGYPPGPDDAEWQVAADVSAADVLATYRGEIARARAVVAAADLDAPSRLGGRFATAEIAPPLVRILFHLLQEYARHVGHLDIARELIDGTVGE